jgi:hypothetical protein
MTSLELKPTPLAIRPEHEQKVLEIAKDLSFLETILYELDFDTIIPLKDYTSHKVLWDHHVNRLLTRRLVPPTSAYT